MATRVLSEAEDRLPDPRREFEREIERALALLRTSPFTEKAAHECRKAIRKSRAILRLMRNAVGETACSRENEALRDAARQLSAVRDSAVRLETLARLAKRGPAGASRARMLELRRAAREEHQRLTASLRQSKVLERMARALQASLERTSQWRLPRPRWPIMASGIERIYRRGRKALRAARSRPGVQTLHESRKQAKNLRDAMAVLGPVGSRRVVKLEKRAEAIADALGRDHDLAMLAAPRQSTLDKAVRGDVQKKRRKLQTRALRKAGKLYRRKPGRFVSRLGRASLA